MVDEEAEAENVEKYGELTGFDPERMGLDLTKDEKLRTTALMLAIKYHCDTIIRDAEMLRYRVDRGEVITPTEAQKVVQIATTFEQYIRAGTLIVKREGDNGEPEQGLAQDGL